MSQKTSMSRWRVKYSRWTPTWFHACEIVFVDALDAADAKAQIERQATEQNVLGVWAVTEASPEMEAAHQAQLARYHQWTANNRAGVTNERGAV